MAAAVLAAVTSAPFYASLLMPDLFAGVLILGGAVLLVSGSALARSDYGAWFLLLTAAMSFH